MLEKAAEQPMWKEKDQKKAEFDEANPGKKYGVGFAQVQKDYGTGADTSALVLEFDADGRLTMRHCAQEIGTGATTAQQIMIGDLIGKIPDEAIFAVTDFPELPLVSNYEAFTTSQQAEDELSANPYWVPTILPPMSASNSVYFFCFVTSQYARLLFVFNFCYTVNSMCCEVVAIRKLT